MEEHSPIDTLKNGNKIPSGIVENLKELRALETSLGNIPKEDWFLKDLERIALSSDKRELSQAEHDTETIFEDICLELSELGVESAEIADIINSYMKFEGGLAYCNTAEVEEALNS